MRLAFDLRVPVGTRTLHAKLESDAARIAIIGASGVGKSTLLRAITGTLDGALGSISLAGERLTDLAPEKRRIGWVPQDALAFPHLTVRANVAFAAKGSIDVLADTFALTSLLDRAPRTLSGGERQRMAIARALAAQPSLILLDEPLSALDRASRAEVAAAIEKERARLDATLLLVSHDDTDVAALADQVHVLDASGVLTRR